MASYNWVCGFVILLVAAFPPFVPNLLISLSLSHHTFLSNEGESYGFGEINIGVFNWFLINPPPPPPKKNLDLMLLRWHGDQIQCAFNCGHQIWTSQYKLETYQLSRSRYSELTPPPPPHPPQKQTNLNQYALFGS